MDINQNNLRASDIRIDLLLIANMIPDGVRVLDVGCGDGELLNFLRREKNAEVRGIELSPNGVNKSVAKGLSVIQGNAEKEISHFPDNSFDYVILSQTLQAMDRPDRIHLALKGKMPVTKSLDYPWYSTPNIHFCTIRDFVDLCEKLDIKIEKGMAVGNTGSKMSFNSMILSNLFGTQGLYVIARN
jgi:SAM-dependent methyltransferase